MGRRWVNHRWLVSTGQRPTWTCAQVLSGPEQWRNPTCCDRRLGVLRRVLFAYCWKHLFGGRR